MSKVITYVKELSPAAKASFWFVVSSVMLKGISFITTPIFTRLLDVADYGTTSIFVTWEGVINIFASLSLSGGVYNVAMTKYDQDITGFTSSMYVLTAVSSISVYIVCIIFNVICPGIFELDNAFLIFMWIQTFTNACTSFWLMQRRFKYLYKSVIAYTSMNSILSPVLAIAFIMFFPENKAYAKVIGSGILGIIVGGIICLRGILRGKTGFNKEYWSYALKFNIPLLPHYLSSVMLGAADKLMINSMVGKSEAGIYSIANSITGIVNLVTQSINMSLIPYTLQSIKKKEFQNLRNTTTGCTVLIAVICIGIMLFAKEGILIFATEEYLSAIQFVIPLSFSILLEFISGIVGNIILYYEKTGYMSMATIITAVFNVVLNFFGIMYFGYVAAGYTTLISSIVKFILYYYGAGKYEKDIGKIINLKMLLIVYAIFGLFMVYSIIFADNFTARLILILLIVFLMILKRNSIIHLFRRMRS